MAIQDRRGPESQLDKSKLLPGENATTLDTKKIFHAFAPGDVHQMATIEEMHTAIEQVTEDIREDFTEQVEEATDNANTAAGYANTQGDYVKDQGDYAYAKGQEAQAIVDSAAPIINTDLQATYADKGTMTGPSVQFPTADNGLIEITNIQGKYSLVPTDPLLPISPDNIAVIHNVGDVPFNVGAISGKNLFDGELEQGGINSTTGNNISGSLSIRSKNYIKVNPSSTYIISKSILGGSINLRFYDVNKAFLGVSNGTISNNNVIFSTGANTHYVRFQDSTNDLNNLYQFELGSTATPYEPYKGNQTPVSDTYGALPDGTRDEFVSDGTTGKKIQRVGKIVYDGSSDEAWYRNVYSNGTVRFNIIPTGIKNLTNGSIMCNKAVSTTWDNMQTGVVKDSIGQYQKNVGVNFTACQGFTDVPGFKTWLASNPITVYYQLETPVESPRDRIFVTSYPGITNVFTTDPLQPTFTAVAKSELWSNEYLIKLNAINSSKVVQNDTVNDSTKIPSSTVTYNHGQRINTIESEIGDLTELETESNADLVEAINNVNANKIDKTSIKLGVSASSNDADFCITDGIYFFNPTTAHTPFVGYGIIETLVSNGVTHTTDNWIWQRAYQVGSIERRWDRQKINDGEWSYWQLITSESVNANYLARIIEMIRAGVTTNIVCFGDSITQGYLTTTPWTTLLQNNLRSYFSNNNIVVTNTGIGGATSSDGVANFQEHVLDYAPDMAILMFGMNDLTGGVITAEAFRNNLQFMIWECKNNHIAVVIMTSTPCMTDAKSKLQMPYIKACFEICEKENVHCLDLYDDFYDAFQNRYFSPKDITDKIHPGDSGADLIKNKILTDIFKVPIITKTTELPVSGSRYGSTDIISHYTDASLYYRETLILTKSGANGLFYRLSFFVKSTTATVKINVLKYSSGGTYNVTLDGINTAVNTNDTILIPETFVTLGTVGYGMHTFEVMYNDWISGGDVFQFQSIKVEI